MAISRLCSISGCGKPIRARGWCTAHYLRWRRHGDPIAGRTANGEPLRYLQDIVAAYEGEDCLIWPFSRSDRGYGMVMVKGASIGVHRIVCEDAHGPTPSPKHEAAHSCGRGHLGCVAKRHLSWKTRGENQADRVAHGTHSRGERARSAKLAKADVRTIRTLATAVPQRELAKRFGVTRGTVSNIVTRRTWAWL